MSNQTPSYIKDPDAVLDYGFDWSNWLASGETISAAVWTVPTGITKFAEAASTTVTTIWLSGGASGQDYDLACKITTSAGRTDERTMRIYVRQR